MIRANDNLQVQSNPTSDSPTRALRTPDNKSHAARQAPRGNILTRHQTMINFWLDTVLLVNFSALIWISVVVQFIFPPAESAAGFLLWGLSLSQFMNVQFGTLCVFFLGIVLHLMMHWSWVCGVVGSRLMRKRDGSKSLTDDGERTIFGVGLMIVLLNIMGLGIAVAALSIQAPF